MTAKFVTKDSIYREGNIGTFMLQNTFPHFDILVKRYYELY